MLGMYEHHVTNWKVANSIPDYLNAYFFSNLLILAGVALASNRNEHKNYFGN
jgi:hypothetical protein